MNKTNKKINYIYTLFLMFFTILAITLPSFAFGPSSDVIYQGIDVSSWQRTINLMLFILNLAKEKAISTPILKLITEMQKQMV